MSAVRITHIITGLGVGGAEMMLYKLLSATDRAQFEPAVIALGAEDVMGDRIRALGVHVTVLGMRAGSLNPFELAGAVIRLAGLLRSQKPDLVQTWMYHADLLGGMAARTLRGVPLAWNIRNTDLDPARTRSGTLRVARLCARLSGWLPDKIITNAQVAREAHIRFGYAASKFVVIPNGFDLTRFRPDPAARAELRMVLNLPPGVVLVGNVARFDPAKDHRTLLAAAGRVAAQHEDVFFVLCGEGVTPENPQLSAWVSEAGLEGRVFLLGRRDDIPRVMAALDVYLSSSLSEAFPNVIGEAMACEVPCVVTDAGDSREMVAETGRVVAPGDPAALAGACAAVLALPAAERARLGMLARERIQQRYALPAVAVQYAGLYQSMLAGGR